jgi:hypothetical protein
MNTSCELKVVVVARLKMNTKAACVFANGTKKDTNKKDTKINVTVG